MQDKDLQKQPEAPAVTDGKPFVSAGQKIHKWSTYLGVDWGLNYVSGMLFSAWGRYTETGQKLWTKPMMKVATWVSEDLFKIKSPKSAGNFFAFFSVIAGGTFTIPPLLILESKGNREGIIKSLDRKIYGKDAVENDPKFAESYAAMENEPKPSALIGNLTRYGSLAPLLATVMFDKPRNFTQPYFDKIASVSGKVYEKVGLGKDKLFKNYSPAQREEEWQWLHANSAIDFGLEPWYAVLHMITFRGAMSMVGKHGNKQIAHVPHPTAQPQPAQEPQQPEPRTDAPDPKVSTISHEQTVNQILTQQPVMTT